MAVAKSQAYHRTKSRIICWQNGQNMLQSILKNGKGKYLMDPMDLIRDKFSQDCTIETVLHLLMSHFSMSEQEAQAEINEYFEIIEGMQK